MKTVEGVMTSIYYGLSGWAVPVYVMISGALFLSRDIPLRKIYGKYIFRILTAFLFWSFVYAAVGYVKNRDIMKALGHFIEGRYHLWFLFMITGLYMIVPFVRKIAESEFLTKYFLVLALIFGFIIPQIAEMLSVFSQECGEFAGRVAENFFMTFPAGYTGYFLSGFVVSRINFSGRQRQIIYFLGFAAIIFSVGLSLCASFVNSKPITLFYRPLKINTFLYSSAFFVLFRNKFNFQAKIIRALSQYSFGAYLVHDAVIESVKAVMKICGHDFLPFNPIISVPVISVIVFVISFGISAILNHIPVLKKYIV